MKKWSNIFEKNNTIYRNAAVSVYLANTVTPARVYDANNRLYYTAPQGHTDINGYIEFYFDSDEYPTGQLFDITCTPNGVCNVDETIRYTSLLIFTTNWSGVIDDDAHKPEPDADVTENHTANDTTNVDKKPAGGFSVVVDDGKIPSAPTGLTISAGIQAVFLKWDSNSETDISHYEIWRNTSNDSSTASKAGEVKVNLFWDGGLTSGTTYYYWIKAVDRLGNISGFNATDGISVTPRDVSTNDIKDAAVVNAKIDNAAVTDAKIGNLAVTTGKIDDLAVTNAKIHDLDATKITTGTLNADRIAAGSITADKINVSSLSAISTITGSITAENGSTLDIHGNLYLENDSNFYFYDDGNWEAYIGGGDTSFVFATAKSLTIDSGGELLFDNTLTPKDAYDLGTSANPWEDLHLQGDLYLHGNVHDPANVWPQGDGAYSCGTSDHRWYEVWTVNQHTGDILFSDTHCPICGRRFKKWDILALKVIKYIKDKKGDEIDCVPVHMQCLEN